MKQARVDRRTSIAGVLVAGVAAIVVLVLGIGMLFGGDSSVSSSDLSDESIETILIQSSEQPVTATLFERDDDVQEQLDLGQLFEAAPIRVATNEMKRNGNDKELIISSISVRLSKLVHPNIERKYLNFVTSLYLLFWVERNLT